MVLFCYLSSFNGIFAYDAIYYVTPVAERGAAASCDAGGTALEPCFLLTQLEATPNLFSGWPLIDNITIMFLPGEYLVSTPFQLSSHAIATFLIMPYSNATVNIVCVDGGSMNMEFEDLQVLKIQSMNFISCASENGLFSLPQRLPGYFELHDCFFLNNTKAILNYVSILREQYVNLYASNTPTVNISGSKFAYNQNENALISVFLYRVDVKVTFIVRNCIFDSNIASEHIMYVEGVKEVTLNDSIFTNNSAVILLTVRECYYFMILRSHFHGNKAGAAEGITYIKPVSIVRVVNSTFIRNSVEGIDAWVLELNYNLAFPSGRTYILNCKFAQNNGSSSALRITGYKRMYIYDCIFFQNKFQLGKGGGLRVESSTALYLKRSMFSRNEASYGGAFYISDCNVVMGGLNFTSNVATDAGGAIYGINTAIKITGGNSGAIHFDNNTSLLRGGAAMLDGESKLELTSGCKVHFFNNAVSDNEGKGGAIFILDHCLDDQRTCPIHVRAYTINSTSKYLTFDGNYAASGSILYGGKLDSCSIVRLREHITANSTFRGIIGIFNLIASKEANQSYAITSDVKRLCFCDDHALNCNLRELNVTRYHSQVILLSVVSVDQMLRPKPSIITSYYTDLDYAKRQESDHSLSRDCNKLKFIANSKIELRNMSVILKYDHTSCTDSKYKLKINVHIKPCPVGFQESQGRCACDRRLLILNIEICDIEQLTVVSKSAGAGWFSYDEHHLKITEYCPYCTKKNKYNISTVLTDAQCVDGASGVLCGGCASNYSIVLGSWRCLKCMHSRHFFFVWLVPLIAGAGVVLVVFLLLLKLTVSTGTMNGLIFYANVVSVSGLVNLPDCSFNPLLSVFISWLNLDLGIQICFYSGMDTYQKTWLQFAFPIYIWCLVGVIIVACYYSSRAMKLMGRVNIDVLATLFLLSYAKLLKTIITVLSSTEILIADAHDVSDPLIPHKVWTSDGNVDFMTGRHIPLFAVAVFLLVFLFLPYTLFLTFGQCLRSLPVKRGLKWVRSTAFISIIDAYHAPYIKGHRYWTGLILLTRCVLFTVYAANTDNVLITNIMFTTVIIMSLLLVTRSILGTIIYKNHFIDKLELSFLLNLELLAATVYYLEGVEAGNTASCKVTTASFTFVFIIFAGIVFYHLYLQMRDTRMYKKLTSKINQYRHMPEPARAADTNPPTPPVTHN